MLLIEVMQQTLKWEWTSKSERFVDAEFEDPSGVKYIVQFVAGHTEDLTPSWDIDFYREDPETGQMKSNITGTGHSFIILSTVTNCISAFISKWDPEVITMTAKESNRATLYKKILLKSLPNWFMRNQFGHFTAFNPKYL